MPEDITFQTKAQLGLEMVREAQKRGVPFGWIGMDCHYGQQQWLLGELESDGLVYIADTPCDTRVWLEPPKTEIPTRKGDRGPIPTVLRVAEGEALPHRKVRIVQNVGLRVKPLYNLRLGHFPGWNLSFVPSLRYTKKLHTILKLNS